MDMINVGLIGTGDIAPAYIKGCAPFPSSKSSPARTFCRTKPGLSPRLSDWKRLTSKICWRAPISISSSTRPCPPPTQRCRGRSWMPASMPTAKSRWRHLARTPSPCWMRRRAVVCAWAARRMPSSAAATRPRAMRSIEVTSASPRRDRFLHEPRTGKLASQSRHLLSACGGPLLDMGPYFLTALVHLLGPAARVAGSARISFPSASPPAKH